MSQNSFITAPELSAPFPNVPPVWTCPITGFKVPKRVDENLRWRVELLKAAEKDTGLQQDLFSAAAHSILFYMNAFCFTYRVQIVDANGKTRPVLSHEAHVPFITWECQDEAVLKIDRGITEGCDLCVEKSRDMGASWIVLTVCQHKFVFRPDSQILFLSRTEKYVDETGNHKSLFWKADYLHQWLPEWMCPPNVGVGQKNRRKMHMHNTLNGSAIDGESTTANAAAGDRRLVILMDEFGLVQNGTAMRKVTRDATPCRIVNSTPRAGSEYSKWATSGMIEVVRLPWWNHPEKGFGRSIRQDPQTKKYEIISPYYLEEEKVRTPREMAEELDMDHFGAGDQFFDSTTLELHKTLFVKPERHRFTIKLNETISDQQVYKAIRSKSLDNVAITPNTKSGELKIWSELVDGRLDQSKHYGLGIDISKGQGASNSVVSIRCFETKEKVGEWVSAQVPSYEFARVVVAIALWVGGANPKKIPYMVWEAQGPGWDFGRLMATIYQYPFYYCDQVEGTATKKETKKYGWFNTREKKQAMLQQYSRLLVHGGFINHSELALTEATTYITYEDGGLGPAELMEESAAARKTHGDRVIADGLSVLGDTTCRTAKDKTQIPDGDIPANSIAGRRLQAKAITALKKRQAKSFRHPYNLGK